MKSTLTCLAIVLLAVLPAAAQSDDAADKKKIVDAAMTTLMIAPRIETAMVDRPPHRSKLADAFVVLANEPNSLDLFTEVYRRSSNNTAGALYALAGMAWQEPLQAQNVINGKLYRDLKTGSVIVRQGNQDLSQPCQPILQSIPSGFFVDSFVGRSSLPRRGPVGRGPYPPGSMPAGPSGRPMSPGPAPEAPSSSMPSANDLLRPSTGGGSGSPLSPP